jgi:hypothetical protein
LELELSKSGSHMADNSPREEIKQEPVLKNTKFRRIFASRSASSAEIQEQMQGVKLPPLKARDAESVPTIPVPPLAKPSPTQPVKLSRRLKTFTTSDSNIFRLGRPKINKEIRKSTELSRPLVQIGEVAFSHKEHVGKDDADQFLVKLLKLREEGYIEIHQQIAAGCNQGYLSVRPPAHLFQQFLEIAPSIPAKVGYVSQQHFTIDGKIKN